MGSEPFSPALSGPPNCPKGTCGVCHHRVPLKRPIPFRGKRGTGPGPLETAERPPSAGTPVPPPADTAPGTTASRPGAHRLAKGPTTGPKGEQTVRIRGPRVPFLPGSPEFALRVSSALFCSAPWAALALGGGPLGYQGPSLPGGFPQGPASSKLPPDWGPPWPRFPDAAGSPAPRGFRNLPLFSDSGVFPSGLAGPAGFFHNCFRDSGGRHRAPLPRSGPSRGIPPPECVVHLPPVPLVLPAGFFVRGQPPGPVHPVLPRRLRYTELARQTWIVLPFVSSRLVEPGKGSTPAAVQPGASPC